MKNKILKYNLLFLIVLLGFTYKGFCHKVNIFAYYDNNKIFTQSYFQDGAPCKNSTIEIFDTKNKKIYTGKTDNKGNFNFKPNKTENLLIVLNAGSGHRAEFKLPATKSEIKNKKIKNLKSTDELIKNKKQNSASLSKIELINIINEVIDKKLEPIKSLLNRLVYKDNIHLSDIIGGIGYIFGIFGILALIKSKKKNK